MSNMTEIIIRLFIQFSPLMMNFTKKWKLLKVLVNNTDFLETLVLSVIECKLSCLTHKQDKSQKN